LEFTATTSKKDTQGHGLADLVNMAAGAAPGLGQNPPGQASETEDLGPGQTGHSGQGDQGSVGLQGGLLGNEEDEWRTVCDAPDLGGHGLQAESRLAAAGSAQDKTERQRVSLPRPILSGEGVFFEPVVTSSAPLAGSPQVDLPGEEARSNRKWRKRSYKAEWSWP
jgi:hypothetical protein